MLLLGLYSTTIIKLVTPIRNDVYHAPHLLGTHESGWYGVPPLGGSQSDVVDVTSNHLQGREKQ